MKENRDNQTAKCLRAISDHKEQLLNISDILVGDCLFASYNFVAGAVRLGFNVMMAELKCGDKVIRKIFFSTDLDMKASEIFLLYHSGFRLSLSIAMRSKTQGLNIGSPLMPTDSPLATTHPFPQ